MYLLNGRLLIARLKVLYVFHLGAPMCQPVSHQPQMGDLLLQDGQLLAKGDERRINGIVFHMLLDFV